MIDDEKTISTHSGGTTPVVRLTVEYDGTDFAGWQVQPNVTTVQGVLEDGYQRIFGRHVRMTASGRTDAGVHASGQVVSFPYTGDMPPERLKQALNGVLPRTVTVVDAAVAPPGFNARFDATLRTYRYTLSTRRLSIGRRYAWHIRGQFDTERLAASTEALGGHCSLKGFSKEGDTEDFSTIIEKKTWTMRDNLMIFELSAIRFFHHAVRGIVGTAVEVARGKMPMDRIGRILETEDRSLAGPTAPAHGLCLVNVDYQGEER